MQQQVNEAIATAKQAAADAIAKHDSTAMKAQIDKEARIEVARIEQQHADKTFQTQ